MKDFTQLLLLNPDPIYLNPNGGGKVEHLYGLTGDDTLSCGKGNDPLVGIEGFDMQKSLQSANDAKWRAAA